METEVGVMARVTQTWACTGSLCVPGVSASVSGLWGGVERSRVGTGELGAVAIYQPVSNCSILATEAATPVQTD